MNRLERMMTAVMVTGIIGFGTGKIIDNKYLTYVGLGATLLPLAYVIIASGKPKGNNHIETEEDQRRNYWRN